ncbi:MAG: GLPGLI family protein [Parafilimonas sp.]
MKKYLLAAFMLATIITQAQIKQGTIIYERKVDVHRRMQDEQMKAMVPQFQTTKNELIFSDNISVYKALPEDNAPDPFDNGGGNHIMIKIGGPGENSVLYRNYTNQKFLEQTELADKDYVINDTIKPQDWKLSDETKTILNHVCKKATTKTERGNDVVAWYTEDIPTPVGPDTFGGLPGAILMIDINNAEMVFTASDFKNDVDNKALNEPSKGKYITRADFNKKVDDMFGPATPDGKRIITKDN